MTVAEKLALTHDLNHSELVRLIEERTPETEAYLRQEACTLRDRLYGKQVLIRGLIEFTNYCRCDCLYCGIRCSNLRAERYRLTREEVLDCCREGYDLGFRTFVLQGGEDPYFTDERLCGLISAIKREHGDCAVTLSVGERSRESYARLRASGADRYLLRHETADPLHYAALHPPRQRFEHRMNCLRDLRELGFQTGCGFMVGSPGQTAEQLASDLCFIHRFRPHMVGIGPFLPHHDTPFADQPAGSAELTLFLLSVTRLLLPGVLLPATTALGSAEQGGRERGILHGANVVMPNLSPRGVRAKYSLYDHKLSSGSEAAENLSSLRESMAAIGYALAVSRGDSLIM